MNWNVAEGGWKQLKGKLKSSWGKLTDDDIEMVKGKRDVLAGKIQKAYGVTQDEAEKQIRDFEARHEKPNDSD